MFELKNELEGIKEYQLKSNGLRVLIMEEHSAPVAAIMVSYAIGSFDEDKKHTGAAHMLEHMMFKGTDRYHRKKNTQIAALLEQVGAVMNANTGHDATHYFEVLPSDRWKLALDIESSRMRMSLFEEKEFVSEKSVIQNELERYFDYPTVLLSTAVWQEAFKESGYHHPIIGWRKDVEEMPVSELKRLYDIFYQPSNAVLTVVGDVETEEVLKEIEIRFFKIKNAKLPERNEIIEPLQRERRFTQVEKPTGVEYLKMSFKMPGTVHQDSIALDLLGMILAYGKTSRLYQRLVEKGLLANVSCGGAGTKRAGLFSFFSTLTEDAKHEDVEKIILEEINRVQKNGVLQEELDRSLSQIQSEMSYSRDGLYSFITELSHAIADGDWRFFVEYFKNASNVKLSDIQDVARKYLKSDQMTVGYLRVKQKHSEPSVSVAGIDSFHEPQEIDLTIADSKEIDQEIRKLIYDQNGGIKKTEAYEKRIKRINENGMDFYAIGTGVKNVISLSGSLAYAGTAYGKNIMIPALTASMLDKGSVNKSKIEIAEILENLGAHIDFHADAEYLNFHIRVLKKDLFQVFDLFTEQLKSPKFEEHELNQYKKRQRVSLQRAKASTGSVALNRFFESLYYEQHLNKTISFDKQLILLEETSLDEIRSFHESNFGKKDFKIALAGDFDSGVVNYFKEQFSGWREQTVDQRSSKDIFQNAPSDRENIHVPGVVNNDVFMGLPIKLLKTDPDFIALYMANYILGADFTSRLSNIVRDRHGYTYGIRSALTGFRHRSSGLWVTHMIVNPVHIESAIKKTKEVIKEFCEKGITEDELNHRKETIKGKFKVSLATTSGLVDQILEACENELGVEYLDRFPNLISDLTVNQVNDAIRRYLDTDKMHIVCAGQFS